MSAAAPRRLLLPEMEGLSAHWYARLRGTPAQLATWRSQAARFATDLPEAARVLEVAPGPGYFAVELARLGVAVTGLDTSRTMVEIARANAEAAGVTIDFQQGDATAMPFAGGSFDRIHCQAAFKNFRRPLAALDEMHRVLRPGGVAIIQDLDKEATDAEIREEVRRQGLTGLDAFFTPIVLGGLRRRAYSAADFERLAGESAFRGARLEPDGVGLEVRLEK